MQNGVLSHHLLPYAVVHKKLSVVVVSWLVLIEQI